MDTIETAYKYRVTLSVRKSIFTRDAWAKTGEDAINEVLDRLNEADRYQAEVIISVERVIK